MAPPAVHCPNLSQGVGKIVTCGKSAPYRSTKSSPRPPSSPTSSNMIPDLEFLEVKALLRSSSSWLSIKCYLNSLSLLANTSTEIKGRQLRRFILGVSKMWPMGWIQPTSWLSPQHFTLRPSHAGAACAVPADTSAPASTHSFSVRLFLLQLQPSRCCLTPHLQWLLLLLCHPAE